MLRSGIIGLAVMFCMPSLAQYNIKRLLEQGQQSFSQGYYVASMQIGMRIVGLKPDMYEAWYMMANSKYNLDDFKGAANDSRRALLLQPYIPDIYDLYAMACIKVGNYDSAIEAYTKALALDKDNKTYLFNRAYCYFENGQRKDAERELLAITDRWKNFTQAITLLDDIKHNKTPQKKIKSVLNIFVPTLKITPNLHSLPLLPLK